MSVVFNKKNNYCLVNSSIIVSVEDGLHLNKLKNLNENSFIYDSENEVWIYNNYKSSIPLVKLLYPEEKITSIDFKNNDVNDYRRENLILTYDKRFIDNFIDPPGYDVINKGTSHKIFDGKFAGQYRNMYWKVKDKNNETYYLMHIKDDIYTKISKRDITKVLSIDNIRPSWYLNANGYIGTTFRNNGNVSNIYLHQLIMDVHDEDLTNFEKTVDHINQDKLDNRCTNLRLVNMSIQNANRGKPERRVDACDLPEDIQQSDLPKYVVYRKEILDKDTGTFREYFYICNHPDLDKNWETTKSQKVSIKEKLKQVKLKLQELNGDITQKQYLQESNTEIKTDFPLGMRLNTNSAPFKLVFDLRQNGNRYGLNYVLKSTNLQNELDTFIGLINEKYPVLKIAKYKIKNTLQLNNSDVSQQKEEDDIKLILPPNFSFYYDSKNKSYYFSYSKVDKGVRFGLNKKIKTNNIQNEFETFMNELNEKYEHIKPLKFIINNTENIKLYDSNNCDGVNTQLTTNTNNIINEPQTTINNHQTTICEPQTTINNYQTTICKPQPINDETKKFKLPTNISIVCKNQDYYLTFTKAIDGNRIKKMVRLTTNDFQTEYNNFIDTINDLYKDIIHFEKSTLYNIPKEYTEIVKQIQTEYIDNTGKAKPVMPLNFSICNVNQVDYIQFNKKIDDKRFQYKTKINSYDLPQELDDFIDQLNEKYDLGLINSDYKIIKTNGWKTTNKIIDHTDTDIKIAQRTQAKKYLENKKQELGEGEFKKQKAQYARQYRANKEIEV